MKTLHKLLHNTDFFNQQSPMKNQEKQSYPMQPDWTHDYDLEILIWGQRLWNVSINLMLEWD